MTIYAIYCIQVNGLDAEIINASSRVGLITALAAAAEVYP